MLNVKTEVTADNRLVITVDLKERHGRSASGKTEIIATTKGNPAMLDKAGLPFAFGLNVYTKGK